MTTTDQQIETEILAKGLTAPRITPADIEANIVSEHYFTAADGCLGEWQYRYDISEAQGGSMQPVPAALHLLTFCVLVLRNGFTVDGTSACASPEDFDAEIGRKIARQNAVAKVWPLMGYELRTELSRPVLTEADALADLNGTPRPDHASKAEHERATDGIDLNSETPLGNACDLSGEGSCEPCQ